MRLDCSDSNIKSASNKHRQKMGEENMMNMNNAKNTNLSKSIRSGSKHSEKTNGNCDGETSDSSEELQYGPGIVNRLKTKYLSMTVREYQNRGARPPLSNLRRANSLENLLAAEKTESNTNNNNNKGFIMSCAKKFETATENITKSKRLSRSGAKPVISRESMKRARSVESLLRTFKDIVIEENNNLCTTQETKVSPVKAPGTTELPPPDVVKETLKIFEKSPVVNKPKNNPIKPTTSSKPNILTEKPKLSCSNAKPVVSPKPIIITQNYKTSNNDKVVKNNVNAKANTSNQTQPVVPISRNSTKNVSFATSPPPDKDKDKPVNNNVNKAQDTSNTQSIKSEIKTEQPDIIKIESPKIVNSDIIISTEVVENNENKNLTNLMKSSESVINNNSESSKSVSNVALNNIRKSGTSVEFKFPCAKSNSYLPQDRNQVRQVGIIKPIQQPAPQVSPPIEPTNKIESNVITNTNTKNQVSSPKNQVNQVVLSIKTENVNLWDTKPWHTRQNTMIFNFCNRKDVPDYIENDGLCLHNRNDANRGKQIFLSDSKHEIYLTELLGPDESSTDDVDELSSNIVFEGANVVQGKSNIQRIKKHSKMNIQFDLNTSVYEYPSEESFVEEVSSPVSPSVPVKSTGSPLLNNTPTIPIANGTSSPCSPSNLSSYQPSKLGINTNQFGMKPLQNQVKSPAPAPPGTDQTDSLDEDELVQRYSEHQINGLLY
uniref:Uncharacterized protein n=1 Tax=Cacopsylla melanoneura TaxID=428564 RepID=A0A8D8X336_9HEMI